MYLYAMIRASAMNDGRPIIILMRPNMHVHVQAFAHNIEIGCTASLELVLSICDGQL